MINSDLVDKYVIECRGHLATIEEDLLQSKTGKAATREELVNRVFRTLHSIIGAVLLFDLVKITELAQGMEDVLALMRSRKVLPKPDHVDVLLRAVSRLRELMQDPFASNEADIAAIMQHLNQLYAYLPSTDKARASAADEIKRGRKLRTLVVEDDFASLFFLQSFLSGYGPCRIAANGWKAVEVVRTSLEREERFDLIYMDIMMPGMDGREALRQIRAMEEDHGILWNSGAKIIMTTAVNDINEVIQCYQEFCDSYLLKPIDLDSLLEQMKSYQLMPL